MNLRPALAATALLGAIALTGHAARAATCNVAACTAEIQAAAGVVVNDIFKDKNGLTASQLPVFGKIVNNWPGCPEHIDYAGAGHSLAPYDCPSQYTGDATTPTLANADTFLKALDRYWWQPCRLGNPTVSDIGGGTFCTNNWTCIADDTGGAYNPWQGLVFDLGGPSNKVAIFAENDHGPQPCESLEYTVFLSDNPFSRELILHPATDGVDPGKWNRAVLSKIFTKGFIEVRPPDPAGHGTSCGDTAEYSVEEDSFVQVFSLPCGITFRYAAIVAGNDGLDFPSCVYHSNEGEIDAVAGLTESGSAVCPDKDNDHYVDCNCPGAPQVCDCNDNDPTVHPGAPEACDATVDLNCDKMVGTPCPTGLECHNSICVTTCSGGENPFCPPGSACTNVPGKGNLCVPQDCGCAPGQVCVNNKCEDACANVVCPGDQVCQDGNCVDPCANVQCPQGQSCQGGQCVSPCSCFAGNIGCPGMGEVCDVGGSNLCVPTSCKGVTCAPGQTCDASTGMCVGFCNGNVACPVGEKCVEPDGCVPLCTNVTCSTNFECDPKTGMCVDNSCLNITCFSPQVCVGGMCVTPDGGGTGGGGAGGGTTSSSSSTGSGASGGTGGSGGGGGDPGSQGKCGCRVPGEVEDGIPAASGLALLGLAAMAARRRRR